jgi:hypothetical protein
VDDSGERGLLGVAFDPSFVTNHFVYVYYTAITPTVHNRISRFTADGDVAVAGSEVVIFELDTLSATIRNGGALAFGPVDGKLYAAVGENADGTNSQSLNTVLGKMLRINPDGTIPTDNPFFASTSGKNRAIWALGLRNPFAFAFDPLGNELFINDVGETAWEEINYGVAGANYGWPTSEGPTTNPNFTGPGYAYNHSSGCAITGGAFYAPSTGQFPSEYLHDYFFADYCDGWIKTLDPAAGNSLTTFATGISAPVDLKVSDDGSLYYLARGDGAVYRVQYEPAGPTITSHPVSHTAGPGTAVTFSVRALGSPPLRYQWKRNGVDIPGATAQDYTIPSVVTSDDDARFRASISNGFDPNGVLSNDATLTVSANANTTHISTYQAIGSADSPLALVQHAGTDAGYTTSSSLAFPSANTAGNWIGVAIRAGQVGQAFTVTDTRGNTYRRAVQLDETVDRTTVAIFYAENIAGGANTVTVADTLTGGTLRFAILEYAGVATSNSLDASAAAQGTSATPNSGTATTTSNGDLVIGVLSTAEPATFTAGSGYVIQERVPGSPNTKLIVEDLQQATAGPVSGSGTLNSLDIWGALVAAFRPR